MKLKPDPMVNITDQLAFAESQIAQITAENERLKKREADNILLAWGGVCPSGWAMTGDTSHMAEIIRQRGDELQTENLRVKAENERLLRVVDQAIECGELEIQDDFFIVRCVNNRTKKVVAGDKNTDPDLFAQLKGAANG